MKPREFFIIGLTAAAALAFFAKAAMRDGDYRATLGVFVDAKARAGKPLCMTITSPGAIAGDVCVNYVVRTGIVEEERDDAIF